MVSGRHIIYGFWAAYHLESEHEMFPTDPDERSAIKGAGIDKPSFVTTMIGARAIIVLVILLVALLSFLFDN
jgi:hypothetical protein